jgi:hypothetical protein
MHATDSYPSFLQHCRQLRGHRTLLSLYEDTASEARRKRVNGAASTLVGDIRAMLRHHPEARALALPELTREELELLEERTQAEAAQAQDTAQGKYAHKQQQEQVRQHGRNNLTDGDNDDPDGLPAKANVERTARELHMRRVHKLLRGVALPAEGDSHLGVFPVLDLMAVRSQLITSAAEQVLQEKRALYESFGVELGLDALVQGGQAGEGREMHVLRDLLGSFRSMLETVSACMLMQSYGPVDSIRRLQREKADLQRTVAATQRDLGLVQNDLVTELESRRGGAGGGGGDSGQSAASITVQLRGEQRRNKALERDLKGAWEARAATEGELDRLGQALASAHARVEEQRREYAARTAWFDPHVAALEQSVASTLKSYGKLETDVQLLSILYQDALKDVDEARRKQRAVVEERDLMGRKLSETIKKLQISKREERRKDMIARKMMLARRTAIDATAEAKGAHDATATKEAQANETIEDLRSRLRSAEQIIARYTQQTQDLDCRVHDLSGANLEMEKRIDRLTQEKIALGKVHASELKELASRPAQEEVDLELESLRGQLAESQMANEALKEALASTQLQMG